jgi:hypothetical protein
MHSAPCMRRRPSCSLADAPRGRSTSLPADRRRARVGTSARTARRAALADACEPLPGARTVDRSSPPRRRTVKFRNAVAHCREPETSRCTVRVRRRTLSSRSNGCRAAQQADATVAHCKGVARARQTGDGERPSAILRVSSTSSGSSVSRPSTLPHRDDQTSTGRGALKDWRTSAGIRRRRRCRHGVERRSGATWSRDRAARSRVLHTTSATSARCTPHSHHWVTAEREPRNLDAALRRSRRLLHDRALQIDAMGRRDLSQACRRAARFARGARLKT